MRAVTHGIPASRFHFFSILEIYNLEMGTFFTPIGEIGLAVHEMYEILGLPIDEIS